MSIKVKNEKAEAREDSKVLNGNLVKQISSNSRTVRRDVYRLESVNRSQESAARRVEKSIPQLAETAMKNAYTRALSSGSKVLIAEAGELKEIAPDGTKKVIKKLEPSIKMRKGQIIKIK